MCCAVLCCVQSRSHVRLFATPWTVVWQAPLSMRILQPRILEWVAMPSSRDLSNSEMEPGSPSLQVDSFPTELPGQPFYFLLVFYQILKSFSIIFFSRHIILLLFLFSCSKMVTSLLRELLYITFMSIC